MRRKAITATLLLLVLAAALSKTRSRAGLVEIADEALQSIELLRQEVAEAATERRKEIERGSRGCSRSATGFSDGRIILVEVGEERRVRSSGFI